MENQNQESKGKSPEKKPVGGLKDAIRASLKDRIPCAGHPAAPEEIFRAMPEPLLKELESLKKYEKRILAGLAEKDMAKLYLRDPLAALKKLEIPVSLGLKQKLREMAARPAPAPESAVFRLPDGQEIKPNIRIRITQ